MKKLLLAATALASLAAPALAADLPTFKSPPAPAPVSTAGYDWSGLYIGGNVGYSWGQSAANSSCNNIQNVEQYGFGEGGPGSFASTLCDTGTAPYAYLGGDVASWNPADSDDFGGAPLGQYHKNANGFAYGAQVGVNRQSGNFGFGSVVYGLEADLQGFANSKASSLNQFGVYGPGEGPGEGGPSALGTISSSSKLDWLTTLRGRLGVAVGPENRVLTYATGGAALAVVTGSVNTNLSFGDGPPAPYTLSYGGGSSSFVQAGLVGGGGVEYALTNNISVGAEYLYVKLYGQQDRTVTFTTPGGQFDAVSKLGFDDVQLARLKVNFKF